MDKIKQTVTKILTTWVTIGITLVTIGNIGLVDIPESILQLFSQNVSDLLQVALDDIFKAVGSIIALAQVIRGIFIKDQVNAEVSILSIKDINKIKYNPFKII